VSPRPVINLDVGRHDGCRDLKEAMPQPRKSKSLADVDRAARRCRACPLWRNATQTVFGDGPAGARIFIIGEQAGDQEDRAGLPFVGPAGQLLDRALSEGRYSA